ncbi:MAG TPA: hypothetical protein VGC97_23845 [Pyrinomonadaceae bacterium]|jgi:hypothetical protein
MLKLLYFVPCEKVILSIDKVTSLINTIDGVYVPPSMVIHPGAAIVFSWHTIAFWYRADEMDKGKEFEQQVELYRPDKVLEFSVREKFRIVKDRYRVFTNIGAFPVGMAGELWLKLSIRESETENEWTLMSEYPLYVVHLKPNEVINENKSKTEPQKAE